MDLNKLSPAALKAAMTTGDQGWGQSGSIEAHAVYVEPAKNRRRKCRCGCKGAASHIAKANGLAMASGCALSMHRWAKHMNSLRAPTLKD